VNSNQSQNKPLISLFTAISIVVANMIGTGVFTSLGFQAADIKSGFALLFLWLVGGVVALCGALVYGELGAVMPRSGGEFYYLSKIYHPAIGFLSGWVSVTVGFAAPIALAAMALGKYFSHVFPWFNQTAIALIVVIAVSLVHSQNINIGSYFQNFFTLLKVLLIVSLIGCGFLLGKPQEISFLPAPGDLDLILSSPFAVSLVYVMYSYSGWNAAVYVASEVKEPEKNVPRALFTGTTIVLVLYLLVNFIFLYVAPISELSGQLEVGYIAASKIFGDAGGKIMSLLISFGLISAISSMVWAGPRVTQTIGEDIPLFKILAAKNTNGVPHYAILLQLAIVVVLLITASFQAVLTFLGFTLSLSSFLTVLGIFVHRFKYPDIPRPYKTWGYPVTPMIFLAINLWMLVFIFRDKTGESLAGLGIISLGLLVYWIAVRQKLANSKVNDENQSIIK